MKQWRIISLAVRTAHQGRLGNITKWIISIHLFMMLWLPRVSICMWACSGAARDRGRGRSCLIEPPVIRSAPRTAPPVPALTLSSLRVMEELSLLIMPLWNNEALCASCGSFFVVSNGKDWDLNRRRWWSLIRSSCRL